MLRLLALAAILPTTILAQTHYGCYTEPPTTRALSGATTSNFTTMTASVCQTFCTTAPNSFSLWGVEYGGECYCANALSAGSFATFPTDCNSECPGLPGTKCGGGNRLSLYGASGSPPEVTLLPVDGEPFTGTRAVECYGEPSGARALAGPMADSTGMTVEGCAGFCKDSGYRVFGMEYARECWCGSAVHVNATVLAAAECDMSCMGNGAQVCGGSDKISIWEWY